LAIEYVSLMKLLSPLVLLFSLVLLFKLSFKLLHLKNEQIVIPTFKLFKILFPLLNYSHFFCAALLFGHKIYKFDHFVILTYFVEMFNFSRNKTISNNKTEYTIAKSSSRRSKLIYYLLYLELQIKRYQLRKLKRSADIIADVSTTKHARPTRGCHVA
jgi:hypothetical protein